MTIKNIENFSNSVSQNNSELNLSNNFLEEFQERGFLAQCTNLDELQNLISKKKISAYIGFDCTAKTLHAGSLIQIMILRLLQKYGHKVIILLGGGTTKIGDPSGKDEARQILTSEKIQENLQGIKTTLEKFISFENNQATLLNNNDWLKNINYIDFLRDVGKHFSINRMLSFDSVKLRLDREQPLSFLEFNYMILQAYDFYHLHKNHNCVLQIGGSDQWGNIVNGVELIRRINATENSTTKDNEAQNNIAQNNIAQNSIAFGLTSPLLTTFDGKKMGKTAEGAIWLDESMLSPYDYFQYFRNTHDADVIKFLKLFTDLPIQKIKSYENYQGQELNQIKEMLAFEATKICHGAENANTSLNKAREIFIQKNSNAFEEKEITIGAEGKRLVDIIFEIGGTPSKADAKRLIDGKAVKINNIAVSDINHAINSQESFELTIGKKKFYKIIVK